jgi:predicted ATPase/class 3 adenylate cyclase
MSLVCAACGAANADSARFCDQCGARLAGAAVAPASPAPTPLAAEPPPAGVTRRQMSVMFCDLVGSTELGQRLDPEDLRDVIHAYREASATVIQAHAGFAAQYIGDGIVAYFGYPVAHEDDARRAARAGLEIVAAIRKLDARLTAERGIPVAVRVAIHTGLTVVGDAGGVTGQERLALGDTPNVAARVQALAAPNTVVVSGTTHGLIAGFFETTPLGRHALKGVAEPVEVYRVDAASGARHRLEAAPAHRMTPYVGRGEAVATLTRAWAAARAGSGCAELLIGEPGVGKSRLLARLRETLDTTSYEDLSCYCSPYYRGSAYRPIVDAIRGKLGLDGDVTPAEQLARLRAAVAEQGEEGELVLALIAQLIGIPPDAGYRAPALHPLAQKQKTAEALLGLIPASTGKPTLMIVEDLHWADPTTVEFLGAVLGKAPRSSLLVLLTARPEFQPPWQGSQALGVMPVSQLSAAETETMIRRATGGKALPDKVVSLLVRKADGNPLFVEEMTRMLVDSPLLRDTGEAFELTGPLPDVLVPTSLTELLTARLDGMEAAARRVLQVAATIGREFGAELVRDTLRDDPAPVSQGLSALLDQGLVFETGGGYVIKHALIQDAAYESLLKRTRQQYHERIARALGRRTDGRTPPEVIAAHFIKAGQPAEAIPYCLQAGQRAVASSANEEAASHLRLGLELLAAQPATPERDRTELALLATLGTALTMQKGWAAPEVAQAYSSAEALCVRVGPTPQLFWVLWGMWAFYLVKGDQHTALEAAKRVMEVARGQSATGLEVEAHFTLGLTHYYLGHLAVARDHLEQAVAAYVPESHHANASLSCQDVGVTSRSVLSMVLELTGDPDGALARSREAVALAERLRHPFSQAYALGCAAWLHAYRREPTLMAARARELLALTRAQALDWWLIWGLVFDGYADIDAGRAREGAARMDEALAVYRNVGTGMVVPYFLVLQAQGEAAAGDVDRALDRLAHARAAMAQGGEAFAASEADRVEADVRLARLAAHASPDPSERERIEALYRRALATARAQGAVVFESRAEEGLARLGEATTA